MEITKLDLCRQLNWQKEVVVVSIGDSSHIAPLSPIELTTWTSPVICALSRQEQFKDLVSVAN